MGDYDAFSGEGLFVALGLEHVVSETRLIEVEAFYLESSRLVAT